MFEQLRCFKRSGHSTSMGPRIWAVEHDLWPESLNGATIEVNEAGSTTSLRWRVRHTLQSVQGRDLVFSSAEQRRLTRPSNRDSLTPVSRSNSGLVRYCFAKLTETFLGHGSIYPCNTVQKSSPVARRPTGSAFVSAVIRDFKISCAG